MTSSATPASTRSSKSNPRREAPLRPRARARTFFLDSGTNFPAPRRYFLMTGTDERLVRTCLEGDPKAFEALVEKYQKPVYNLAFRMAHHHEDALDIAHTVFLKAYQHLRDFKPRFRFYSWLYRIAINESLDFVGRRRETEPVDEALADGGRSPEDQASLEELGRNVEQALMQISSDQRAVIVLRHFLDCSYAEMAEVLEIPEKTVKSRLFSARGKLKDVLLAGSRADRSRRPRQPARGSSK